MLHHMLHMQAGLERGEGFVAIQAACSYGVGYQHGGKCTAAHATA